MSGELFCPKCGSKHDTNDRYCQYCGEDLEDVIVQYKSKQLPVRYQNDTVRSGPTRTTTQYSGSHDARVDYDDDYSRRGRRRYRDDGGFFDVLLSILFFWVCCGPGDCDCN